jgi:hypothetical protein
MGSKLIRTQPESWRLAPWPLNGLVLTRGAMTILTGGALVELWWPLGCGGWLWDSKTTALCHLIACAGCSPRARGTCTQDGGCSAGRPILLPEAKGRTDRTAWLLRGRYGASGQLGYSLKDYLFLCPVNCSLCGGEEP